METKVKKAKRHSAKLKWTIEIGVDPLWVADGFDMTDERAKQMLEEHIQYAMGHEVSAKVLRRPPEQLIKGLQSGAVSFPGSDS